MNRPALFFSFVAVPYDLQSLHMSKCLLFFFFNKTCVFVIRIRLTPPRVGKGGGRSSIVDGTQGVILAHWYIMYYILFLEMYASLEVLDL